LLQRGIRGKVAERKTTALRIKNSMMGRRRTGGLMSRALRKVQKRVGEKGQNWPSQRREALKRNEPRKQSEEKEKKGQGLSSKLKKRS